ncbi:MAG: hypothetical protein P1P74_10470 [Desulfuromonadales bacterium]|nr:hypothetical protein [Desulfuromonadales bacterium]
MMRIPAMVIFLYVLMTLPSATASVAGAANSGIIEGRVIKGDEPVAGMMVAAYGTLDYSARPLATTLSGADGSYRLELPAGVYAVYGRLAAAGLFAFCGRNPVTVTEQASTWAGLQAVTTRPATSQSYADPYSAAIEGQVLAEGKPLADAYVYLYLDVADDLKGQGYRRSPPTGKDGFFAFDGLPESDYFLVARKRSAGGQVGPVLEGDWSAIYTANPLTALAGKTAVVTLCAIRKTRAAAGSETFSRPGGALVKGRVLDSAGDPAVGVHVFAYTERVIGHKRPAALSAPLGADGMFVLSLPEAGRYYLGAREEYGDSPLPGERFGMYDKSADHGLEVSAGAVIDNITIVVEPVRLD